MVQSDKLVFFAPVILTIHRQTTKSRKFWLITEADRHNRFVAGRLLKSHSLFLHEGCLFLALKLKV